MMRYWVVPLVVFLFSACADKLVPKPEGLIPEDKMTEMLYDLALIQAAKNSGQELLRDEDMAVMEFIFEKYNADSTRFAESNLFYASQPLLYERIHERIEKRITDTKKILDDERGRVNDSVKKAMEEKNNKLDKEPSAKPNIKGVDNLP